MLRKMLMVVLLFVFVHPAAAADPFTLRKFQVVGYDANVVLSPDGHTLAVYEDALFNQNKVLPEVLPIQLVDLDSGQPTMTLTTGITDYASSVAFSSDGKLLASAHENGRLNIWDAASGERLGTYRDIIGPHLITFIPNSHLLLDAAYIPTIISLWDADSGDIKRFFTLNFVTFAAFKDTPNSSVVTFTVGLAPTPDGQSFATLMLDGTISLHDLVDTQETTLLAGSSSMSDTLALVEALVTPDGQRLLYGNVNDHLIHILDMATRQESGTLPAPNGTIGRFFAVAPDNDTVAVLDRGTPSSTGTVHLYSLSKGTSLLDIPLADRPGGRVYVNFTPDGKQLLIGGFPDTNHEGHNVVYVATLGA